MFSVGDVVGFFSEEAGKDKYHLCISFEGHFLFLNSPKKRAYPGDFVVPCSEVPCPPTDGGKSIISCSYVMQKSDSELQSCNARKLGAVSSDLLSRLSRFVKTSPVLNEDEKDAFYEAAGDWI